MGRPKQEREPLPPIWEAPDELWAMIEPILAEHDPPKRGPKRIDQRRALDAVSFRMRSGCQWNRLPKEYPDDSSVHRTFQRWVGLGIFDRIWAVVQEACEDLGGCDWEWQAADTSMGKARMGGPHRPQSDRPRQARREALPPGRGRRRPACGGGRGSQRSGRQTPFGDHRGRRPGATRARTIVPPAPVPRQGLRQRARLGRLR